MIFMIVVLVRMNLFLLRFISTPIGLFFLDVFLRGGGAIKVV